MEKITTRAPYAFTAPTITGRKGIAACEEVAPLHTCNQIVHKTDPQCFTAFIPAKL